MIDVVRALAVAGRDAKLGVQDIETAEPGPGQVRVAVEAASVNAIDAAVAAGYLWDMMQAEFPVVLGRDFAGTVEAVGTGVTAYAAGDRVTGVFTGMSFDAGSIAEAVTVDAATLAAVPAGLTPAQAAAAGLAAVTAHDLTEALSLSSGDVVLVSGATGGVGAFAVQLAAATGATVLATTRPGQAADFVLGLGAHQVIDYTADLAAGVRSAAPDGVTAIVHAAGDAAGLAALLAPGGRLASALGATLDQVDRDDVAVTPVMGTAPPEKLAALLDAVASGALRVPVAHTYTLDDSPQAIADFGGHKLGKLVIATR